MNKVRNEEVLKRGRMERESGSESIEMVCAGGENG